MTENGERARYGYGFGVFRLYPAQRLLLRGDQEADIGQRAFSILQYMVENPGRIISQAEIIAGAFTGISIDTATLWTHIANVRGAIGPDAIVTINNQGYQFIMPVERLDGPAPRPVPTARVSTSLPRAASTGGGREAELAEMTDLLAQNRLITVVGSGGIGKTWLAIELGWRLIKAFPGGVHLIDLAPAKEAAAAASTMARALGVPLRGSVSPVDALSAWIDQRKMLLIFDSCEHVITVAGAFIGELLERAPGLSVIATSQEILKLRRETVYCLKPLSLPAAIDLFVTRAMAADQDFRHGEHNKPSVAEICRRLDGVPLALEMVATLVPVLDIEAIKDGLAERLRMMTTGLRLAEDSHSTLLKMVKWSHGLLKEGDREVFRRLSIFAGSFSLDAATIIAGGEPGDPWVMGATLRRLVDKSMLMTEPGEQRRFRLLETLRLYASERLIESGEAETVAGRHGRYIADLFETADAAWETLPDSRWLASYGPVLDDVRDALDRRLARPGPAHEAIALAGASARLWYRLDLAPEGRRYCDKLVARIDSETPPESAARLLRQAGILWRAGDRLRSLALKERSADFYRDLDDRLNLAAVQGLIGGDYIFLGRFDDAQRALSEARRGLAGSDLTKSIFAILNQLGALSQIRNETSESKNYFDEALDLAQTLHDAVRENIVLANLGEVEFRLGSIAGAIERGEQAASGFRAAGQRSYLACSLVNLTAYLTLEDKPDDARIYATEALSLLREEGGHWLRLCIQIWALLAADDGKYAAAAQLIGFVTAGYQGSGEIREPLEQEVYDRLSRLLAAKLSGPDIDSWAADGARWNEERAVTFIHRRILSTGPRSAQ